MRLIGIIAVAAVIAVSCGDDAASDAGGEAPLAVFGAYATAIEEPWDGVIHSALKTLESAGKITYSFADDIGYSGDMERVLTEVATEDSPAIVFGDAFGNEEAVRNVAKKFPGIAFVFGSGGGPAEPNFSVFDNWIHEPAYLAGLLAGSATKSNVVGVVAGLPVPEVNRLTNAFAAGAREVSPDVQVLVTFINSWFDPATAREAALAQIDAKADVLYAERFGVIEAAAENGLLAIGNMSDQAGLAPGAVITSAVWSMQPTVDYVVAQVRAGSYQAQELKDFSMMAKGGASLAPINESLVSAESIALVESRLGEIRSGLFRVDIDEAQPEGSSSAG